MNTLHQLSAPHKYNLKDQKIVTYSYHVTLKPDQCFKTEYWIGVA
jgi:hypothetical protein